MPLDDKVREALDTIFSGDAGLYQTRGWNQRSSPHFSPRSWSARRSPAHRVGKLRSAMWGIGQAV